ncbi:hypothetical protein IPC1147_32965 [Pseudomonas aeruginosa]|nr:hypothetical protein [Pseudomonas aeruginosa]RQC68696.1 hypothetical protein IPC353_31980 [Pseudomonas aeruginosa]RRS16680.1 hypothetical protein IPC1107_32900 [Pseudomonas aeruginosa]RRS18242.1 hypothetical protein IPC1147_32965 [Pseudomonas aeruginosa]
MQLGIGAIPQDLQDGSILGVGLFVDGVTRRLTVQLVASQDKNLVALVCKEECDVATSGFEVLENDQVA